MKIKIAIAIGAIVALIIGAALFRPKVTRVIAPDLAIATTTAATSSVEADYEHRRETWLSALEWCESRGDNTAVNWHDRDGTPSYFAYQFKPSTFEVYAKKYNLIPTTTTPAEAFLLMHQYELTRAVVRDMTDDPSVNWLQQFPDCVKRVVGFPPKR